MESRVHSGYFADNNPVPELRYLFVHLVCIVLEGGCGLKADWAHVMIIAVVNVGLLIVLETSFQFIERSLRVNSECRTLTMEFERNASLPKGAEVPVQEVEPKDQCIVSSERAKRYSIVGWLEAEYFEGFFG